MIHRKYFLIKYTDERGNEFYLNKGSRKLIMSWKQYNMSERYREYKTYTAARRMAERVRRAIDNQSASIQHRHSPAGGNVEVIEVCFVMCNPELPDGFYKPVETPVCNLMRRTV